MLCSPGLRAGTLLKILKLKEILNLDMNKLSFLGIERQGRDCETHLTQCSDVAVSESPSGVGILSDWQLSASERVNYVGGSLRQKGWPSWECWSS